MNERELTFFNTYAFLTRRPVITNNPFDATVSFTIHLVTAQPHGRSE
jgi:hypothetical protein